jgi:hypothetical protein
MKKYAKITVIRVIVFDSYESLEPIANLRDQLPLVGKLTRLQFRVDKFAVDRQLEAPATRWFQFKPLDLLFVLGKNFGRQTDRLWFVVSSGAISQVNLQQCSPTGVDLDNDYYP